MYAALFNLTTFELICRLSPQWVPQPSLWLSTKTNFSSDIFIFNIVFGSLLFQFNSAGSEEIVQMSTQMRSCSFFFFLSCYPMDRRPWFHFCMCYLDAQGCFKWHLTPIHFGNWIVLLTLHWITSRHLSCKHLKTYLYTYTEE